MDSVRSVTYKLTYFNARGWAEPIRWIFAVAKVPYEDVRVNIDASWAMSDLKKMLPWGQLPYLEMTMGKEEKALAQSVTIARYLARKFQMTGVNEWESAQCDEIVDSIKDFTDKWKSMSIYLNTEESKREEMKRNLMDTETPKYMGRWNERVTKSSSPYLVGMQLTWADLYLVSIIMQWELLFKVQLTKGYKDIENLVKIVTSIPEIAQWLSTRPQTVS